MPKIRKIKLNKIKSFFEKLPKNLAQEPFLTFLGLLVIALFLGGVIFYFYSILIEIPSEFDLEKEGAFEFDKNTYQKIIDEWQLRNNRFSEINLKEYPDIFK